MTDLERIKEKYKNEDNKDINTLIELVDGLYVTLGEVSMSFTEKVKHYEHALENIAYSTFKGDSFEQMAREFSKEALKA